MSKEKVQDYCKDLEESSVDTIDKLIGSLQVAKLDPYELDIEALSVQVTTLLVQLAQCTAIKQTIECLEEGGKGE